MINFCLNIIPGVFLFFFAVGKDSKLKLKCFLANRKELPETAIAYQLWSFRTKQQYIGAGLCAMRDVRKSNTKYIKNGKEKDPRFITSHLLRSCSWGQRSTILPP